MAIHDRPSLTREQLESDARHLSQITSAASANESNHERLSRLKHYLEQLFGTALDPSLASIHRIKAFNTICGFVELCLKSDDTVLKTLLRQNVFRGLLDAYVGFFDGAKAKALKQVSGTLLALLQDKADDSDIESRKRHLLSTILTTLFVNPNQKKAKPALVMLSACISKDILGLEDLVSNSTAGISVLQQDPNGTINLSALLGSLFNWLSFPGIAPAAATLVETILKKHQQNIGHASPTDEAIWISPLISYVTERSGDINAVRNYLIPLLLKLGPAPFWQLLKQIGIESYLRNHLRSPSDDGDKLLPLGFALLQVGVEHGLVVVTGESRSSKFADQDYSGLPISYTVNQSMDIRVGQTAIEIPAVFLGQSLLADSSHEARLAGLSLLIASPQMKRPISGDVLETIKQHLRQLFSDVDPWFRMEMLGLFETLLERLQSTTAALWKAKSHGLLHDKQTSAYQPTPSTLDDSTTTDEIARRYHGFTKWLVDFLMYELHPSASYQRRISSIRALVIVLRSGLAASIPVSLCSKKSQILSPWPFQLEVINRENRRLLFDLLLDPFDDIRQHAQKIIGLLKDTSIEEDVWCFLEKSVPKMRESGRIDHADGVGRAYCVAASIDSLRSRFHGSVLHALVDNVDQTLQIAADDIHQAVASNPVHGYYISLRYIVGNMSSVIAKQNKPSAVDMDDLEKVFHRVLKSTELCWEIVKPILCNDAPEGFNLDESDEDHTTNTKDLLSYAWRALKESSLLIRTLVEVLSNPKAVGPAPCIDRHAFLSRVGEATFSQLSQLRHRGAFSTVAQTFATICSACERSNNLAIQSLLESWYQRSVALVSELGNAVTRRSAGIPALFVGILSSNPWNTRFVVALELLETISMAPASDSEITGADLPQVHAMNILRAIFTTSKLSERSEKHITTSMSVATNCLSSQTWAIRNCGLMLLRSLIDRLIGCHESTADAFSVSIVQSKVAYSKYPGMLSLLEDILKASQGVGGASVQADEAVFPVLDILRRAPPPHSGTVDFLSLILRTLAKPQWHLRELASRSFISCLRDTAQGLEVLRVAMMSCKSQNELHGLLMCLKNLCEHSKDRKHRIDGEDVIGLVKLLNEAQIQAVNNNSGSMTTTVFFEALNELGAVLTASGLPAVACDSYIKLSQSSQLAVGHTTEQGSPPQTRAVLIHSLIADGIASARSKVNSDFFAAKVLKSSEEVIPEALESAWQILKTATVSAQENFGRMVASIWLSTHLVAVRQSISQVLIDTCESLQTNGVDHVLASELCSISEVISQKKIQISESLLRLQGHALAAEIRYADFSACLTTRTRRWIALVRTGLNEHSEYPLRYASISSLSGFSNGARALERLPASVKDELCFAIYDSLVDDDEDIRQLGAVTARAFLESSAAGLRMASSPVPAVAAQTLATYLSEARLAPASVAFEAQRRLTGQIFATGSQPLAFSSLLAIELHSSDALFAVERQNLYIDDAEEAVIWSKVLQKIDPRFLGTAQLESFTNWCVAGLETLLAVLPGGDGMMGWTSRPTAFVVGMQLFRAVAVLMVWAPWRSDIGPAEADLIQKLHSLATVGRKVALHELWLREIDLVLAQATGAAPVGALVDK